MFSHVSHPHALSLRGIYLRSLLLPMVLLESCISITLSFSPDNDKLLRLAVYDTMRPAASLPVALLLFTAELTMATSSPSVTAAPTTSHDVLSTFITTASNCTHTNPTHCMHRRDTDVMTSAPTAAASARPPVFTSVTCIEESNYGEEDGYVKHICKTFEYRLKELESGAECALPLHSTLWGMAVAAAITVLF